MDPKVLCPKSIESILSKSVLYNITMSKIFKVSLLAATLTLSGSSLQADWPSFLGPNHSHASSQGIPLKLEEGKGILWKSELPGEGWSSPVVLDGQVWMTTALDDGKSLRALCVDLESGKLIHNVEVFHVAEPEPKHKMNSHASPTPVLEDGRVYISFGMYGSACLDAESGKAIWKNTELEHDHDSNGPGSTPILYKDLYILNCDGTELRYVAALNKHDGKLVWKTNRSNDMSDSQPSRRKAYATPAVFTIDGRDQLISPGAYRISSYDPLIGKELWSVDSVGFSNVPVPLQGEGLVYVTTGFPKPQLWAIDPSGKGLVNDTHVRWVNKRSIPAKPSPILVGDHIYTVADNGIVSCIDSKTGDTIWFERVGAEFSATPLHVDGKIYLFGMEGEVIVLKAGTEFKVLAESKMGDGFMASPSVVEQSFVLRSKSALYRVRGEGAL